MEFSESTEVFINFFVDNFQKFYKKKDSKTQKDLDDIYTKIFKDLTRESKKVKNFNITKEIVEIFVDKQIPHTDLLDSHFVPSEIKNYIKEESRYYVLYKGVIPDKVKGITRKIEIVFTVYDDEDILKLYELDNYVKNIFMILSLLASHAKKECSKNLKIYFYFTPFTKDFPKTVFIPFGPENCNSGLTTNCAGFNEICIYRKEEFFKLLIHEAFHAFGMDFSSQHQFEVNKKIKDIFPIESDFNIFEAYSEFWAVILNCAVLSFNNVKNNSLEDFLLYMDFCVQIEIMFSMFQLNKILSNFSMNYEDLYLRSKESSALRKHMYRENTNVFSYYILKTVLLYNYVDFLKWNKKNNLVLYRFIEPKHLNNYNVKIEKLLDFIRDHYKNKKFITDLEKTIVLNNSFRVFTCNNLKTTLRMTLLEIKV